MENCFQEIYNIDDDDDDDNNDNGKINGNQLCPHNGHQSLNVLFWIVNFSFFIRSSNIEKSIAHTHSFTKPFAMMIIIRATKSKKKGEANSTLYRTCVIHIRKLCVRTENCVRIFSSFFLHFQQWSTTYAYTRDTNEEKTNLTLNIYRIRLDYFSRLPQKEKKKKIKNKLCNWIYPMCEGV